jgi:hypothetical protein
MYDIAYVRAALPGTHACLRRAYMANDKIAQGTHQHNPYSSCTQHTSAFVVPGSLVRINMTHGNSRFCNGNMMCNTNKTPWPWPSQSCGQPQALSMPIRPGGLAMRSINAHFKVRSQIWA